MNATQWRVMESALFAELSAVAADADRRARLLRMYETAKFERVLAEVTEIVETTAEEVGDARAA